MARAIAKAGAWGSRTNNVLRDLFVVIKKFKLEGGPEPYYLDLEDGGKPIEMFLPHEIYHDLLSKGSGWRVLWGIIVHTCAGSLFR